MVIGGGKRGEWGMVVGGLVVYEWEGDGEVVWFVNMGIVGEEDGGG